MATEKKDVEMSEATSTPKTTTATTTPELPKEKTPSELAALFLSDLKKQYSLLERAVTGSDSRLVNRVLRSLATTRRKLTVQTLKAFIEFSTELDPEIRNNLLNQFSSVSDDSPSPFPVNPSTTPSTSDSTPMEISASETPQQAEGTNQNNVVTPPKPKVLIPEIEMYLRLLVIVFLIDKKKQKEALEASIISVKRLEEFNRRTLNPLSAKIFFYYARTHELLGRVEDIRSELLAFHRTASLRHNDEASVTLLNLILRNYLEYNLYDQADKFVSKTQFKEEAASNEEFARYLYYQGKIKSIQLDYTDAYACLQGAMRKAPQHSARGFRLAVTKLACIVQCLIGEIPERSLFRQPGLQKALEPYLELVRAVRVGDLNAFHDVLNKHATVFRADKTFTLIQRLRHNVIKTGLRKINISYSKISLNDIKNKLRLESVEDVEFIVAKAIRDKVINATIDHKNQFLQSKETIDIYSTEEPQSTFHRRITFCLNTHNDAVKAMRFPQDIHKVNPETAKERREREQEIAKNLADEEDESEF